MLRHRTLLQVSALLAVCLLGFPAAAAADCVSFGNTYGSWELPPGPGEEGYASGVVVDPGDGELSGGLEATLSERPALRGRRGNVSGTLSDLDGNPVYGFEGTWRIRDEDTGGTWAVSVFLLATGQAMGRIEGDFDDSTPDAGAFEGAWFDCTHP